MNNTSQNNANNSNDRQLRVRYRWGDAEFEAEGHVDDVNEHAYTFIKAVINNTGAESANPQQSNFFGVVDTPLELVDSQNPTTTQVEPTVPISETLPDESESLVDYYLRLAESERSLTQHDQLLVITDHALKNQDSMEVSRKYYKTAYHELRVIPVSEPNNLSARLNELIDRGHLIKGDENGLLLTYRGREYIKELSE